MDWESLGQRERDLFGAMEIVADGVYLWNVVTDEIFMSGRILRIFGYGAQTGDQSIQAFSTMLHPEDRARIMSALESDYLEQVDLFEAEYRLRDSAGAWRWLRDRGRVMERDADRRPLRVLGAVVDISEQKAKEEEARDAAERVALAQEGAGAGIWDLDMRTGEVRLCARSLARHGLRPENCDRLSADDWRKMIHPDDASEVQRKVEEAVATGSHYSAEFRTVTPEGTRWLQILGSVLRDAEGRPQRFVGINLDITDRKRQEEALRGAELQLMQMSRLNAMGTMASVLAHELNQPLTAIATYAASVRRLVQDLRLDPMIGQGLDGIDQASRRAGAVIRALRNYVAEGTLQLKPESLSELVQEAVRLALTENQRFSIQVRLRLDANSDMVMADRIPFQQLLCNLIRNAADAMQDEGSPEILIASSLVETGEVEVSVSDNGSGISEEAMETLFSPFNSTKREGMGVGLAICRTIAEAHGGCIRAARGQSGGTIVSVTIGKADTSVARQAAGSAR